MDDRKRKREINGVDTPSKRVAFPDKNAVGKVKITLNDENGPHPALISSATIKIPDTNFDAYTKKASKEGEEQAHPHSHELWLQSSQHPRLHYTASSCSTTDYLAHYIAVFDPQGGDVQLVPVHHLNLCRTPRAGTREVQDGGRRTHAEQKEDLVTAFGTKRARKAIVDKAVNAIRKDIDGQEKTDRVQTAILEAFDDAMSGNATTEQVEQAQLAAKPIPTPNVAAEFVEDVYPITTLIPATEYKLLNTKKWQEKASSEEKHQWNSRYVARRIDSVITVDNPSRLKALIYFASLIDFYNALQAGARGGKKVPKKDVLVKKLPQWPESLIDLVRKRFSDANNELSKWHQDLLCTHMCALTLYIDGYATDTTSLTNDLKLDSRQISQYYLELGCQVKAPTDTDRNRFGLSKALASVTRIAKLKLPLNFPKPRTARRK